MAKNLELEANIIAGMDELSDVQKVKTTSRITHDGDDFIDAVLSIEEPLYEFNLGKVAMAKNKLPLKVMQDDFICSVSGITDCVDSLGADIPFEKIVEPVTPEVKLEKQSLSKTGVAEELFDDPWVSKAYKALDREYKKCGDTQIAMKSVIELFDDKLAGQEKNKLDKAVASLDMTSFLKVFAYVLKRA